MSRPTTRSERLGLEPGSVTKGADAILPVTDREIAHSIAISLTGIRAALERIADQGAHLAAEMAEIKANRKTQP